MVGEAEKATHSMNLKASLAQAQAEVKAGVVAKAGQMISFVIFLPSSVQAPASARLS
jgi:hypothetical protein